MLKNYLLVAFRNLMRNWSYSLINIIGFALGLAVSLLIFLIVLDDISYDRYHYDPHNTYRLITQNRGNRNVDALTSGALTREVALSVPEVVATTRVFGFGAITLDRYTGDESQAGIHRQVLGTDSTFFKVFPAFKILEGDPDRQLVDPNTAVVTREVAQALFGDDNPIGKTVQDEDGNGQPVTITGVVSDCPNNSHFHFDILVPALVNEQNSLWWASWDNISGHGYLRAIPGSDQHAIERKMEEVGYLNGLNDQYRPLLQPILDVHLGSGDFHFDVLNDGKSDRHQVRLLAAIALLTLVIASINFINLSSARAIKRAREVGMRKVVGAQPGQIMGQYLGESVLLTLIAMIIAATIVELALPHITGFIGKELTYTLYNTPILNLYLLLMTLMVGLISGVYPALILTRFRPVAILKGHFQSSKQGVIVRQVLVVLQYAISIALIASVVIILQQLQFVQHLDKGYESEQTLITFTFNPEMRANRDAYMTELRKIPSVEAVCASREMFGFGFSRMEGRAEDSETNLNDVSFYRHRVGENFIPAMGINLLAGRNFDQTLSDSGRSVILNEAAVRALGWRSKDPIGKRVIILYESGVEEYRTVIGVVGDFAVTHAREQIEPVCMEYLPGGGGFVSVRLKAGTIPESLERIEEVWNQFFQDIRPFFHVFLDERFNQQYNGDRHFATNVGVFSGFAIVIASLGLLGLSSYNAEQRRREIAIRKVLGSGERRILFLLTRDAVKWVLLANIFGWAIAYLLMNRWLQDFAYRMSMSPVPFLIAGIAALFIATLTVSIQAWRAALTNPTTLLHQE